MESFLFPDGKVWVLDDGEEIAVAQLSGGDVGVLLFTDDDLAASLAEKTGLSGKKPRLIWGERDLISFLENLQKLGVSRIIVDQSPGRMAREVEIGKVIEDARKRIP